MSNEKSAILDCSEYLVMTAIHLESCNNTNCCVAKLAERFIKEKNKDES